MTQMTSGSETAGAEPGGTVSRRAFMRAMIVMSGIMETSPTAVWARASARVAGTHSMFSAISPSEGEILTAVLNRLVPAEGALPQAGDLGVATFIDQVAVEVPGLKAELLEVIGAWPCGPGADAVEHDPDELLRVMQQRIPASFENVLRAAYIGYYSHPAVLAALGETLPLPMTTDPAYAGAERAAAVHGEGD